MFVGIDFGTVSTTIAYLEKEEIPRLFFYEGQGEYLPSIIYQEDGELYFGNDARLYLRDNPSKVIRFFKMFLPLEDDLEKLKKAGWSHKLLPSEALKLFLARLLLEDEDSFTRKKGKIKALVFSVPELWFRSPRHSGPRKLKEIVEALRLPLTRLISEPVAAAAAVTFELKRCGESLPSHLLVCDMGGGTFDVCFCKIAPEEIRVEWFSGEGEEGVGGGGVRFDQEVIRSCITRYGKNLSPGSAKFLQYQYEFEEMKTTRPFLNKINRRFKQQKKAGTLSEEAQIIAKLQGELPLTYEDVKRGFAVIEEGVRRVLSRFKSQGLVEDYEVVVVGGFGRFALLQEIIKRELKVSQLLNEKLRTEFFYYAVAYGACLVAANKIKILGRLPYGVSIKTYIKPTFKEQWVTLVEKGQELEKLSEGVFGKGFYRVVPLGGTNGEYINLQIEMRFHLEESIFTVKHVQIPPGALRKDKRYRLGIKADCSELIYLLLEEEGSGRRVEVPIDVVLPRGPVLILEET